MRKESYKLEWYILTLLKEMVIISVILWPEGAPHATGEGVEDCPSITPYLLDSSAEVGAIIVCPGGGYGVKAEHEGAPIAEWLNSIGFSAFVLNYRVAPYKHPAPLLDAQRAIRYVRHHAEQWNIAMDQIGILGFSAGGHLASTAGTHYDVGNPNAVDPIERVSCRPDLMVLCYPVITFMDQTHNGSMMNLIGEQPSEELRVHLSNERQVNAQTPPAFLWHTADDEAVPVENCLLFSLALSRHQVPHELHIYESGRHGLGLAENDEQISTWTHLCQLWLEKQWA